jgi:hypothetical protein
MELLASYASAEYPLALYLTDGQSFSRLKVQGRCILSWTGLTVAQALVMMANDLNKVDAADIDLARAGCLFVVPPCRHLPSLTSKWMRVVR